MTVSQPLRRPVERLLRALSKHLPMALKGEIESLHKGRVATRRLREILPLCACEVPGGVANRALRRVRRLGKVLGDVREIDVSIGVAEEIIQAGSFDTASGWRLQQHLQDQRQEQRERMLDSLSSLNVCKLERDLADVARVLGIRQQTGGWVQMLAVRMERRSEGVQSAIGEAGSLYVSDRVHRVRIATKKLRYTLELARDTGEARTREAVRELKEAQEVLGRLHDLEVFGRLIQDLKVSTDDAEDLLVRAALESLRRTLNRDCRDLHSQYVGKRESLLRVCRGAVTSAGRIWSERDGASSRPDSARMFARVLRTTAPAPKANSKSSD